MPGTRGAGRPDQRSRAPPARRGDPLPAPCPALQIWTRGRRPASQAPPEEGEHGGGERGGEGGGGVLTDKDEALLGLVLALQAPPDLRHELPHGHLAQVRHRPPRDSPPPPAPPPPPRDSEPAILRRIASALAGEKQESFLARPRRCGAQFWQPAAAQPAPAYGAAPAEGEPAGRPRSYSAGNPFA